MKKSYLRSKKSLGQNFLIDENIVRKFVSFLALDNDDFVLEIGPGRGILTKNIIPYVKKLVIVEIDKQLCHELRIKFQNQPHLQIIEGDFLKINLEKTLDEEQKWKIIGNIPYHITSPIIFNLLENKKFIHSVTLTIQKEVAQRIVAPHNIKEYGILSIICQLYADVKILFYVSKNVFYPRPNVDSAVVRWNFLPEPRYVVEDEKFFLKMIKTIFSQRRKVLKNSIKPLNINVNSTDSLFTKRPEQLTIKELVNLSNLLGHGY